MNNTENYKLRKPDYLENADIDDINANMDIIDGELKNVNDRTDNIGIVYDPEYHAIELGEGGHPSSGGGGSGYTLTAATEDRLGGIKIGSGLSAGEDGTTTVNSIPLSKLLALIDKNAVSNNITETGVAEIKHMPVKTTDVAFIISAIKTPASVGDTAVYVRDGNGVYHPVEDMQARQGLEEKLDISGGTMTGPLKNNVGVDTQELSINGDWVLNSGGWSDDTNLLATGSKPGLMGPDDKKKLDDMAGTIDNKLDKSGGTITGDLTVDNKLAAKDINISTLLTIGGVDFVDGKGQINPDWDATPDKNGFMSGEDKKKLDDMADKFNTLLPPIYCGSSVTAAGQCSKVVTLTRITEENSSPPEFVPKGLYLIRFENIDKNNDEQVSIVITTKNEAVHTTAFCADGTTELAENMLTARKWHMFMYAGDNFELII